MNAAVQRTLPRSEAAPGRHYIARLWPQAPLPDPGVLPPPPVVTICRRGVHATGRRHADGRAGGRPVCAPAWDGGIPR